MRRRMTTKRSQGYQMREKIENIEQGIRNTKNRNKITINDEQKIPEKKIRVMSKKDKGKIMKKKMQSVNISKKKLDMINDIR